MKPIEPRGTWLVSEREYGDFILEFEWKLGERGNSGTALRCRRFGDPALESLELQMVDPRYYRADMKVTPSEVTGSLYKAVEPTKQRFKATDWNQYPITCQDPLLKVVLNGETILDVNRDAFRADSIGAEQLAQRQGDESHGLSGQYIGSLPIVTQYK